MRLTTRQKTRKAVSHLFFLLFPVFFYYLSPVIPTMGGFLGIITGALVVFLLLLVSSTLLGRSFCSWVCPAGTIQDKAGESQTKAVKPKKIGWIKFLIWTPWLAILVFLFYRAGGIREIEFAFHTQHGFSVTDLQSLVIFLIVSLSFFFLALIFGRRTGCHTLCWMSPFMIVGMKIGDVLRIPRWRIDVKNQDCNQCKACDHHCPMSLSVSEGKKIGQIASKDCILCGNCVDACPKQTLGFGFHNKGMTNYEKKRVS